MDVSLKLKHVLNLIQNQYCHPEENQEIVHVLKPLGGNLLSVETTDKEIFLVSIPQKFRQSIWIKANEYILINRIKEGSKVKGEMVKKLTTDHIKYYQDENIWPKEFVCNLKKNSIDDPYEFVNTNRPFQDASEMNSDSSDENTTTTTSESNSSEDEDQQHSSNESNNQNDTEQRN